MSGYVWYIPVNREQFLIFAPFHGITTLVNYVMAESVSRCLENPSAPIPENAEWIGVLRKPGSRPDRKWGVPDPVFLGLIPTRGCMMRCAYCDFVMQHDHPLMSFDLIRKAIDGYEEIMRKHPAAGWNIHFFGGEPFAAYKEVVFAVIYAREKAASLGISVHFEVTTNGYYSEEKAHWIAENFDTVVLSLDGFPDTQNRHRPCPGGKESFSAVCRSADIFSRGSCELIIRSCVSDENADELKDWAEYLSKRWTVSAVCLEPMTESSLAEKNGLRPPDPETFVRNWAAARQVLSKEKIQLVYSSGNILSLSNSLCPMGKDALIVSPEGFIGSCWQLSENQQAMGLDLHFGSVSRGKMVIDEAALEKQRERSEENRESCKACFCYAHCAGGCMLNRKRNKDFCRMTRIITLWQLLEQLGCFTQANEMLVNSDFQDWLAERTDFLDVSGVISDVSHINFSPRSDPDSPEVSEVRPEIDAVSRQRSSMDVIRGWLRNGTRIITADIDKELVNVLEGEDALRFQLEHSGMTESDIESVYTALREERN